MQRMIRDLWRAKWPCSFASRAAPKRCARDRIAIAGGALVLVAGCGSTAKDTHESFGAEHSPPAGESLAGPADLVLRGGRIVTVDDARPEATALAVRGDHIALVGTDADVASSIGPSTRVIDLEGKLAIPGFIEGHGHFLGLGEFRTELDLTRAESWEAIVQSVAEAAKSAAPGAWVRGRGWHQDKWAHAPSPAVDGMPTNEALNRAAPDHPVLLVHASGHACIANAKALELAHVDAATADPSGGKIVKDANGKPTGVLLERAEDLVQAARESQPLDAAAQRELARRYVKLASDECLSKGITSFQDAGSSLETVDLLREMAESHALSLRLWVMLGDPNQKLKEKLDSYRVIGAGGGFLTVRAIKRYMDGALGSHGAWLLEPYSDMPGTSGINTNSIESITEAALLARTSDYQLCVHAIGDRANRETLDVYEKVLGTNARTQNRRWRIEHAQHIDPADVPRFAEIGVIAAMQGIHCTSDGPWVVDRLGEKRAREDAYVWKSLLRAGVVVSNGTDTPVEDVDPIACYYASVTRQMKNGKRFFPEQCMSREEALRSYTLSPAFAAFEEKEKGSLAVGKLADITVLSKDILTIPEDEIPSAKVVCTIVGGKIAYHQK
jgi:predicted amidohydrolase YtcJ